MVHQENEGLLSSYIRDIRLKAVSSYIESNSTVLDLACGQGNLSKFLPSSCKYYGVDRVPPSTTTHFTDFTTLDLAKDNSLESLETWLPQKPDYITCIAFLEHITNPEHFLSQYCTLLAPNGKIVGTTPHPRGRLLHESLSRIYLCSRQGAEEHEDFLRKEDIKKMALTSHGTLTAYKQFLFGLNQLFVIQYPSEYRER